MLGMVTKKDSSNMEKVMTMINSVNRTVEVRLEEIMQIERSLGLIQMMAEEASELVAKLDLGSVQEPSPMQHGSHNNQVVRALAAKQDDIKVRSGFALLKIRDMIHKGATEDVSSLNRREPSTVDIPRGPTTKLEEYPPEGGNIVTSVKASPFDIQSPFPGGDKLPLKYIKTGDNTKAPFQKPSTIFAPTPVKAQLSIESKELLISSVNGMMSKTSPPSPVCKSPKKRPRRDRNRARSKGPVMPEPVIQRLLPGDTNKIPEDGYLWRKYGNKSIKTASFKRGYYKCRHFKELRCNALKRVQQINGDPTAFTVYYIREHTCRQPDNDVGGAAPGSVQHLGEGAIPLSFHQFKKEVDMDEVDLDWASGEEDTSNSASRCDETELLFRPPEGVAVDTSTGSELSSAASPLFDMPSGVGSQPWNEPVSTMVVDTVDYNKIKLESCPPDGQEESLLDDDMQLLKFIQFGDGNLWSDPMNDLSYWVTSGNEYDHFHNL